MKECKNKQTIQVPEVCHIFSVKITTTYGKTDLLYN